MATSSNLVTPLKLSGNEVYKSTYQGPNKYAYIVSALGIILLIGSMVATGCLYSRLGYTSFAIVGGGLVLSILSCFSCKYCVTTETVTRTVEAPPERKDQVITTVVVSEKPPSIPQPENTTITTPPPVTREEPDDPPEIPPDEPELENTTPPEAPPEPEPSPPPKVEPALPPLPSILELQLDATHPLSQALPMDRFPTRDPGVILGYHTSMGINPAVAKEKFKDKLFDDELLDTVLLGWIDGDRGYNNRLIRDREEQIEAIKVRIAQLDQAVQLKERIHRLKNTDLKLRDLLPAWADSRLKLVLMMDEELSQLTAFSIKQWDNKLLWDGVSTRIQALSRKKNDVPSLHDISTALLVDLAKCTADQINAHTTLFPLITCQLIDLNEFKKIDFDKMTHQKEIIDARFPRMPNGYPTNEAQQMLNAFEVEHIYHLAPYLSNTLWQSLKKPLVSKIDFSKLFLRLGNEMEKQRVVDLIFPDENKYRDAPQVIQSLEIANIYHLSPYLSDELWKVPDKKQVVALDFATLFQKITDETKRKQMINAIFHETWYGTAASLLKSMQKPQVELIKPYLSAEAAKFAT